MKYPRCHTMEITNMHIFAANTNRGQTLISMKTKSNVYQLVPNCQVHSQYNFWNLDF